MTNPKAQPIGVALIAGRPIVNPLGIAVDDPSDCLGHLSHVEIVPRELQPVTMLSPSAS
jgi:hypothetical protein